MALTRANVEVILSKRSSKIMTFVGLDGTTVDGANADLNDPIGVAIRECGGTTASVVSVADTDLDTVDTSDYDKLFDIAEHRLLATMLGNFDKYGLKVGPRSGYQSQVREGLEKRIDDLKDALEAKYGYNAPTPEMGAITLDIADHNEDLA